MKPVYGLPNMCNSLKFKSVSSEIGNTLNNFIIKLIDVIAFLPVKKGPTNQNLVYEGREYIHLSTSQLN